MCALKGVDYRADPIGARLEDSRSGRQTILAVAFAA
jgi:hypothetical protein